MAVSYSSCCAQLAACQGLAVVFPNSTTYNTVEKAYWSLQEAFLMPSCIVKATTSHDVLDIISRIANNDACSFAIKGQGHAPAAGFANIDEGITIDLTSLSTITVDEAHSVASVGAGASWLNVYTFLDPLGKTVSGGRNGAVGVGGLTLGGGIGYFGPQIGFTCDTVVNFEIVLASGHMINANDTSHQELFRALKGGGNNFGVVTRFDFATVPISEILGGSFVNNISERQAVFHAFTNIAAAPEYDVHASIVTSLVFNSTTKAWIIASAPVYTKPIQDPPVYQDLFAVPNVTDNLHITQLHTLANETALPQLSQLFFTGTYGVSAQLLHRIFEICNNTLYEFEILGGAQFIFGFEPLPTVFVSRGAGKNVLGTSPEDGDSVILLFSVSWSDSASTQKVRTKAAQVMGEINRMAKEMKLWRDFVYTNYADTSQRPYAGYGEENAAFLRKVAKRYDPRGVFQKQVPGGFKLHTSSGQ